MDFSTIKADGCPEAGDFICHSGVEFSFVVEGSSTGGPPELRTASLSAVGMRLRGVSLQCFPCVSSESEVLAVGHCRSFLGGFVAWAASGRRLGTLGDVLHGPVDVLHGPIGRTLLNLSKILFACSIPFDIVFVGWVVKSGGGGLSWGGIQFAKDVEMLPSVP